MTRVLTFIVAVAATLLLAVGCGGEGSADETVGGPTTVETVATAESESATVADDSALCESLRSIEASLGGLTDVQTGEGAVEELRQSADEIETELDGAREAAGDELGDELDSFETAVAAVRDEVDAIVDAGQVTRDSLVDLGTAVVSASTAFAAIRDAKPDCGL
ncbi:MAG TPA: hypothetical protein VLB86_01075 [Gaiellaceae bacterium]|nr:hypothetical protein [Gaiellaceae bacterium]